MNGQRVIKDFPFHQVEEIDSRRHYLIPDPTTGEPERLISVTTALELNSGDGLVFNAAIRAAAEAFAELPKMVAASRRKPCERKPCAWETHTKDVTCPDCPCGTCRGCVEQFIADAHQRHASRRADEGTRAHDVIETWALFDGQWRPYEPDIEPYVTSFRQFIADFGITPDDVMAAESIVLNREHGYAGTLDMIVRIRATASDKAADFCRKVHAFNTGERLTQLRAQKRGLEVVVLVDFKTREKTSASFYTRHAKQLAGYRHATVLRAKVPQGVAEQIEFPMPATDAAMIVQLRPDDYSTRLMVTDDNTFRAFLRDLENARWEYEHGPAAVSSHTYVLPETLRNRERAAEKAAAGGTVGADTGPAAGVKAPPARPVSKPANTRPDRSTAERIGATTAADPFAVVATGRPPADEIPF